MIMGIVGLQYFLLLVFEVEVTLKKEPLFIPHFIHCDHFGQTFYFFKPYTLLFVLLFVLCVCIYKCIYTHIYLYMYIWATLKKIILSHVEESPAYCQLSGSPPHDAR